MASLTKTKVMYSVKLKRGSTQPPLSTNRTTLTVQEIPPALCHLTGDALATPFPPIAPGGYIKYYKIHYDSCEEQQQQQECADEDDGDGPRGMTGLDWKMSDSSSGSVNKRKRRASSASTLLGPLLSHTPEPWPSREVPPKSNLFHRRSPSSPESPPSPVSPSSPQPHPKRHFLSVIHEVSRETMRSSSSSSDTGGNTTTVSKTPRKLRVVSFPPSLPTTATATATRASSLGASALALSLITAPPPRSHSGRTMSLVPLSPIGSLRRKKRQVLRTPSVENDFARHAKEILGLPNDYDSRPSAISRESSSGSDTTEEEEEESSLSPTMSVNTAMTSLLDPSSLPSSPTNLESKENDQPHDSSEPDNYPENTTTTTRCTSVSPDPAPPGAFPNPQIKSPAKSGSNQSIGSEAFSESSNESPTISTPPTSVGECHVVEDKKLQDCVGVMEEDEDEDKRDSWASYETAKSSLEPPLPVAAAGAIEVSLDDGDDDGLKRELAASVHAFHALVALNE